MIIHIQNILLSFGWFHHLFTQTICAISNQNKWSFLINFDWIDLYTLFPNWSKAKYNLPANRRTKSVFVFWQKENDYKFFALYIEHRTLNAKHTHIYIEHWTTVVFSMICTFRVSFLSLLSYFQVYVKFSESILCFFLLTVSVSFFIYILCDGARAGYNCWWFFFFLLFFFNVCAKFHHLGYKTKGTVCYDALTNRTQMFRTIDTLRANMNYKYLEKCFTNLNGLWQVWEEKKNGNHVYLSIKLIASHNFGNSTFLCTRWHLKFGDDDSTGNDSTIKCVTEVQKQREREEITSTLSHSMKWAQKSIAE